MIDAMVLAGGLNNGPLQSCSKVPYEALIEIGPNPMINYVINALQNSGQVGRVIVVGPAELKSVLPPGVMLVESGYTVMENLHRGCSLLKERFLLATGDIPLLTPEVVTGFLSLCGDKQADIYFPLVTRESVEKMFPGARRTYIKFKEGIFTAGNLFLINPREVERCLAIGQELVDLRKKPLSLARRVGLVTLTKLIIHQLSLTEAQNRASRLLGIDGKAVACAFPELGMDVDKPDDLQLIRQILVQESKKMTVNNLCRA
ncbi:NTP transferase domain-containing protein [Desulforamulus aquiferis]|uniref:NTP transferase domain-containing protein n=1 Tax=Desulforamulus aquiferis TaxID=1397668 RepID=A0AAW7ZEC8_9FIRM|nr:NTP transferase domain-containing protein [Desulforamulus aquiferis]MDO7788072.1 NTP transferase domain-containing protein [Desulforamulus aquiferis]